MAVDIIIKTASKAGKTNKDWGYLLTEEIPDSGGFPLGMFGTISKSVSIAGGNVFPRGHISPGTKMAI